MKAVLKKFVRNEEGLETVEWAVLAAIIITGVIGVIGTLAGGVKGKFESMNTAVNQ